MYRSISFTIALSLIVAAAACSKNAESSNNDKAPAAKQSSPAPAAKPAGGDNAPVGTSMAGAGGDYTIDSAHTQALFRIKHLGLSYQYGQFTKVEGGFQLDEANPSNSEVQISIPTASVFTAVKKRDDHLRSPDFFDAKQFPDITFKSTKVAATSANTYAVTGDLTMHGVTKPLTLNLEHVGSAKDPETMGGAFRAGFHGEATLDRTEWGMTYMQGAGLGDEVTLLLSVEGTRK